MVDRVVATDEALQLIEKITARQGSVIFYQSGGCCDGTAPMCYVAGDFILGDADLHLGTIGGIPFYMHKSQYDYTKHTKLIIDAIDGRGPEFSLDSLEDMHFITRSHVFTEEEYVKVEEII